MKAFALNEFLWATAKGECVLNKMKELIKSHKGVVVVIVMLMFAFIILVIVTATRPDVDRLRYVEKEDGTLEVVEIKNTYKGGWFCKERLVVPVQVDGKTVTSVGSLGSTKLREIVLPESIIEIKPGAFSECESLEKLDVAIENKSYSCFNGILYNKEKNEILFVPKMLKGNVELAEDVTSINGSIFSECKYITSVKISKNVVFIGKNAFSGCESLEKAYFEFPNGWYISPDKEMMNKEAVFGLDDPVIAAQYLQKTYSVSFWTRP